MQLTRHTDYGLRILVYLALNPDRRIRAAEIAKAFAISQHHVLKVVNNLASHQVIATHRGKNGGITLAKPPSRIGVGDVVRGLENQHEIVNCTKPLCPVLPACRLRGALARAHEAFLAVLDDYTLEHLVEHQQPALRELLPIAPPGQGHGHA